MTFARPSVLPRMFVLERNADAGGHYPTQLAAIRELSGRELTLISNHRHQKHAGASASIRAELRTDAEVHKHRTRSIERDVASLSAIFGSQPASSEPISVFAPSAADHDVEILVRYARENGANVRSAVRLLADRRLRHLNADLLSHARELIAEGLLQVFAETVDFAEHIRESYGLQVAGVLTLPCNQPLYKSLHQTGNLRNTDREQALRVFLPGGGRSEKGLDKYPALFRVIRHAYPRAGPLHLVFQKPKREMGLLRTRIMLSAAFNSTLSRRQGGLFSVSVLPPFLDEEHYARELHAAHIVLLPYEAESYWRRGSGAVLDGVSARCRIAHTTGIGYSELLQHGNAAAFDGISGIPDALIELRENCGDPDPVDNARKALRDLYSDSAALLKTVV